jgi:hypothetical protein
MGNIKSKVSFEYITDLGHWRPAGTMRRLQSAQQELRPGQHKTKVRHASRAHGAPAAVAIMPLMSRPQHLERLDRGNPACTCWPHKASVPTALRAPGKRCAGSLLNPAVLRPRALRSHAAGWLANAIDWRAMRTYLWLSICSPCRSGSAAPEPGDARRPNQSTHAAIVFMRGELLQPRGLT